MKGKKIIAAVIVILAALFVAYRFLGGEETAVVYESRPTVSTEVPQTGDIILYSELIGTIQPVSKADVIPKMAGEVLKVNFQAGDHVEVGQVLCRLDSDALTSLRLSMEAAQITLAESQRNLARIQALYDAGTVSQQELEQIQDGTESARIAYESAKNQYDLQMEYTTITAPISGTVESRNIDVHDFASAGAAICTIASDGQSQVEFGVTERTHENISVGDVVSAEKGGNTYEARITEIGSMLSASTGLYDVTAVFEGQTDMTTGSRVKLTVVQDQAIGAMTIPLSAVNYDNGIPYVYCAQDGAAVRTNVEVGIHDNERIEIVGGLNARSQVITTWSNELVDGAEILLAGDENSGSGNGEEASAAGETEPVSEAGHTDAAEEVTAEDTAEETAAAGEPAEEAGDSQ